MYKRLSDSILYYREQGFIYVEAPWLVDTKTSEITKPKDRQEFMIKDKALVGSGEQSFLQMVVDGSLLPGAYVCCTPCFRDEEEDETHKTGFMKTELIDTFNTSVDRLHQIVDICARFFEEYVPVEVVKQTDTSYDIVHKETKTELGSYSIKTRNTFRWICATGCAEPRLSFCIDKTPGYHTDVIAKRQIGSHRKILEEIDEFEDAVLSRNKVMALVELSDVVGSIELFLEKHHPSVSLNDLIVMSRTTQRAFRSGRRE